jgi:hypothetical protein
MTANAPPPSNMAQTAADTGRPYDLGSWMAYAESMAWKATRRIPPPRPKGCTPRSSPDRKRLQEDRGPALPPAMSDMSWSSRSSAMASPGDCDYRAGRSWPPKRGALPRPPFSQTHRRFRLWLASRHRARFRNVRAVSSLWGYENADRRNAAGARAAQLDPSSRQQHAGLSSAASARSRSAWRRPQPTSGAPRKLRYPLLSLSKGRATPRQQRCGSPAGS